MRLRTARPFAFVFASLAVIHAGDLFFASSASRLDGCIRPKPRKLFNPEILGAKSLQSIFCGHASPQPADSKD
jgi:hypothetical protein